MTGRELFNIWQMSDINYWANFVKPSLFANTSLHDFDAIDFEQIQPPTNIKAYNNRETAFIVDLLGEISVTAGLGLARMGFMPVPLYSVINERSIGDLKLAIDNGEILEALYDGIELLKSYQPMLSEESAPAFLIDYRRLEEIPSIEGIYDNRWNVVDLDFPSAEVLLERGINKVVLWTAGPAHEDIVAVLRSYSLAGISVVQYINEELLTGDADFGTENAVAFDTIVTSEELEIYGKDVIKFEIARFAMGITLLLGVTNLISMMLIWYEPWLWTVPSIMWLTYLWVPEALGDFLAFIFVGVYWVLWATMRKTKGNIVPLMTLLSIDTLVFYIYVVYYDITDWMYGLGWPALIAPVIILLIVSRGVDAWKTLNDLDFTKYMAIRRSMIDASPHLRWLDIKVESNDFGYDGYGGNGRGGYRSRSGYRGYSSFGG